MRKNTLKIALICLTIAAVISIYGICYAGPECRTYGMCADNGDHYQIQFECQAADGFMGVLKLKNNGKIMLERVYFFLADVTTGYPTVYIPSVCELLYMDSKLIYKEFDMVFKEEK